jgi:hypothetical protein
MRHTGSTSWFDHLKNKLAWWKAQVRQLFFIQYSQSSSIPSHSGPNIFLDTPYSNIGSLCPSLNVREKVVRLTTGIHFGRANCGCKTASGLKTRLLKSVNYLVSCLWINLHKWFRNISHYKQLLCRKMKLRTCKLQTELPYKFSSKARANIYKRNFII